jgi:hypothetical protein
MTERYVRQGCQHGRRMLALQREYRIVAVQLGHKLMFLCEIQALDEGGYCFVSYPQAWAGAYQDKILSAECNLQSNLSNFTCDPVFVRFYSFCH